MNATNMNGKVRKSLASQIDRLDATLDGLAENLNEAVASAVKEAVALAVKEAVQAVVTEVLANPPLLAQLGAAAAPVANSNDDVKDATTATQPKVGLRTRLARVKSWIGRQMQAVCTACRSVLATMLAAVMIVKQRTCHACVTVQRSTARFVCASWLHLQAVGHYLVRVLSAFATGLATGVAAMCLEPYVVLAMAAMAGVMVGWMVPAILWRRSLATS